MMMPVVQRMQARVTAVTPWTTSIYRVQLALPTALDFLPGQYLQVLMSETDKRPFSIASAPQAAQHIELHIGATPDNRYAYEVLQQAQQQQTLMIEAPLGSAYWRAESSRPVLLVAGGTGFSYAWSILQAHLAIAATRPITLYWGVRQVTDLYLHEQLLKLSAAYPAFHYRPVVEMPTADWRGATGLVHAAVLAEQSDLAEADVYTAGRFEMVRVVRDSFHAQGLPLSQLFGDALAYL